MVISSSTLNLVTHCDYPQYAHGDERQQIQQQIPAAIARWSGLDRRAGFSSSLGTIQTHAHSPEFLSIEVHFGSILNVALHVLAFAGIESLRGTATGRLHTNLNLQVRGQLRGLPATDHYKEQCRADIRISPYRNDVRTNVLIYKQRKRRTLVSTCSRRKKKNQRQ